MWGVPYFSAPMAPINLIPSFSSRLTHCFPHTHPPTPFLSLSPLLLSFALSSHGRAFQSSALISAAVSHAFPNWPIMLCPLADLLTKTLAVTVQLYYRGGWKRKKKLLATSKTGGKYWHKKTGERGQSFPPSIPSSVKLALDQSFHLCKKRVFSHKKSATFTTSPHPTLFPSWCDRRMTHACETDTMVTKRKRQKKGNTFQHLVVTNNAASKSVISLRVQNKRLICVVYNQSQWLTQTTEKCWFILMAASVHI